MYCVIALECLKIELSFAEVAYITSGAIGKLIDLHKRLHSHGCLIFLRDISEDVLAITKLDRIFRIKRRDEDDPEAEEGGVPSRLIPPKPSGNDVVRLKPPTDPE